MNSRIIVVIIVICTFTGEHRDIVCIPIFMEVSTKNINHFCDHISQYIPASQRTGYASGAPRGNSLVVYLGMLVAPLVVTHLSISGYASGAPSGNSLEYIWVC